MWCDDDTRAYITKTKSAFLSLSLCSKKASRTARSARSLFFLFVVVFYESVTIRKKTNWIFFLQSSSRLLVLCFLSTFFVRTFVKKRFSFSKSFFFKREREHKKYLGFFSNFFVFFTRYRRTQFQRQFNALRHFDIIASSNHRLSHSASHLNDEKKKKKTYCCFCDAIKKVE